jgi:hypothetical protein
LLEQDLESALAVTKRYGQGLYEGLRYGVTGRRFCDGKRTSLFARALAGDDVVSFNRYRLRSGEDLLRRRGMLAEKVVAFVLRYGPRSTLGLSKAAWFVRSMRRSSPGQVDPCAG